MQPNPVEYQPQFPIELLAHFVRSLPLDDKIKLVKLVPELKTIGAVEGELISQEQIELMDFFDDLVPDALPSLPDGEIFINGLTFIEFFSLPEAEKDTIWAEAHAVAEIELSHQAQEVASDAIPA